MVERKNVKIKKKIYKRPFLFAPFMKHKSYGFLSLFFLQNYLRS